MNLDLAVFRFAAFMVLLSAVLTYFVSPYFVLLTAFIGLNMLQSSFTKFCPAASIFRKLGFRGGCVFC
ncbi:MAG: DUF2892 domain-containing protein [Acidobacteriia bacterium]|nr:DUF2892 domain-containing protein [Methyloceanibacter sp.]MBX5470981.1 DUF2892 domain-containing protein [Acetobacteraceae bacterium]MCL6491924.1 DUF2892 domain-containing protein [Terriglobia bacterium]